MLRVHPAILFGEHDRDVAHHLIGVLLEHFVAVFAGDGRKWECGPAVTVI
jgi:hypothetical protein